MHHIICHVFFGFFIILGICDIIIFLISKFFKIADAKLYTFFIPIKGHMEDIEFIIRSMMFRFRFLHPFSQEHLKSLYPLAQSGDLSLSQ